jgi:hypothetical protein
MAKHHTIAAFTTLVVGTGTSVAQIWTPGPSMTMARAHFAVAADSFGNIYAMGGRTSWCPPASTAGVESLNATSISWLPRASLPIPLTHHAAVGIGGFIYVIGGLAGDVSVTGVVQRYDVAADAWNSTAVPPLNVARMDAAAVADTAGRIYVIGGWDGSIVLLSVEVYDLARPGSWTLLPLSESLQTARSSLTAAIDHAGRIYAITGTLLDGTPLTSVERFDPSRASAGWTHVADAPMGGAGRGAATGADGNIYVVGGSVPCCWSTEVDRYDPDTDTWAQWSSLSEQGQTVGTVLGPQGRIYAVGGVGPGCPNALSTVETLTTTRCEADCNGDGHLNVNDFMCFLNKFAAGCPQ